MDRQQKRQFRSVLLLCVLVSPSGLLARAAVSAPLGPEAAAAPPLGAKPASARLGETIRGAFTPETYQQAVDSFAKMMGNAYNMNGLFGVDAAQLKQMNLPEQYMQAADTMRSNFRQGLADLTQGTLLQNASLAGLREMAGELGIGNGSIAKSIMDSAVPITLAQDGQPHLPLLNAVGTWLGQQVQAAMKSESQPGGRLAGLLNVATPSGRKLQQLEETPLDAAADSEETLDAAAAAARDIERIRTYVANMAALANEVLENAGPEGGEGAHDEEADDDWEDVDDDKLAAEASHKRKLAQDTLEATPNGDNPFTGIANAFRFIFSNTFDWARANGLYGLVPIIADIRGFFSRYNWIADLLLIIATPVENFVNANFIPLPQTNDDFYALVRRFFADYCTYEEVASSAQVLGELVGPTFSVRLVPVSCPIYADPVTGRSYVSFADCDPAQLVIRTTPLIVTQAYLSAAEYVGAECKYTEVYGVDTNLNLGGGEQEFTFRRSAQGIDIVPTLIQINPDLRFFPYAGEDAPTDPGQGIQLTAANNITRTAAGTVTNPSITLENKNAA